MKTIITRKVKDSLRQTVSQAAETAKSLGLLSFETLPEVVLEVPKDKNHGNFSTNLALVLAKTVKKAPRDTAQVIISHLPADPYIAKCEMAGPGFINFYLNRTWLAETVQEILVQREEYGDNDEFSGRKILLEFVSANPVGPMNVVNARAAALGDTLARLFNACGADARREYYINDYGVQVETLGRSVDARYRELLGEPVEFPEEGYRGDYIYDIARQIIAEKGNFYLRLSESERVDAFREFSYRQILASQKADLSKYGVNYENWFSERSLHQSGAVEAVLHKLEKMGLTYTAEGAVWLRTTDFGDDKDRVLRTADGRTTYFTADIAYHLTKFERGFDLAIDILGPDHHGYIGRMKAAIAALGISLERFEVLIAQQINLIKDGQPYKMSKRRGDFITMTDLLEEVGNDVARWFFLMRSTDSHLDFDLDLAKSQSNENPVFYVQYAYARICSIFNQAETAGIKPDDRSDWLQYYEAEEEMLIEKAAHFPEEIISAARQREPHRMTGYLLELAGLFHSYYNRRRIITDESGPTQARLVIAKAIGFVLKRGLALLGVNAPERM
ncbi:MAG TPA: arginine--tRNA ligase [Bacillota bacterium]|nr:arginine--tRNA ligase [Bacillota bacterium]